MGLLGRILFVCVIVCSTIYGGDSRDEIVLPRVDCLQSLEVRRGIECRLKLGDLC